MERNRWETAILCLEVALHPNTGDDQVIAAVNGFRRLAGGAPLSEACIAFAEMRPDRPDPAADRSRRQEQADRLREENRDLRRRLDAEALRVRDLQRRFDELDEALLAARRRADAAAEQVAELRAAADALNRDNRDLRSALADASHARAPAPMRSPAPPFRDFLAAAHRRPERAGVAGGGDPAASGPAPRRPWVA